MSREKENQCLEEFISVYHSEKCLWKIKSADYHDRMQKESAYQRLVEVWKEVEPNCNKIVILKKINNLRSSYRKELKKVRESTKSGSSTQDLYVPKLWYYNLLNFLDDQETPRTSRSNLSDEESNDKNEENVHTQDMNDLDESEDSHDIETIASPGSSTGRQKQSRLQVRPSASDTNKLTTEVLTNVNNHFKAPTQRDDKFDAFGKMIALKMRELPNDQRRWAEKLINDVLFEAEGGNLDGTFAFSRQISPQFYQYPLTQANYPHASNYPANYSSPSPSTSSQHSAPTPSQSPTPGPHPFPQGMNFGQQLPHGQQRNMSNSLADYVAEYNDIS